MTQTNPRRTRAVLDLVLEERKAQEARYGVVNTTLVSGTGPETRWLGPYTGHSATEIQKELRRDYEDWEDSEGAPTWVHLVREELAEAFQESDPERLAEELVQVAALCVSWVERLPLAARGCEDCASADGPYQVGGRHLCLDCAEAAL